jgi:hypothetical protein
LYDNNFKELYDKGFLKIDKDKELEILTNLDLYTMEIGLDLTGLEGCEDENEHTLDKFLGKESN